MVIVPGATGAAWLQRLIGGLTLPERVTALAGGDFNADCGKACLDACGKLERQRGLAENSSLAKHSDLGMLLRYNLVKSAGNTRETGGGKMNKRKVIIVIIGVVLLVILVFATIFIVQRARWASMDTVSRLDSMVENSVDDEVIFGALVRIESRDGSFIYEASEGNLATDDVFPLASITKMYTAAVIYQLVDDGVLNLSDTIDLYLTSDELDGLHYYDGRDNGHDITIEQLLSQTSGLPDYFTEEIDNKSVFDEIVEKDRFIDFEEMLQRTRELEPHFLPGTPGKAYYNDINFDILGVIAERETGMKLEDIYAEMIFEPLELENTNMATADSDYAPIYYNGDVLEIPLALSSFRACGGMISDMDDLAVFLKAFLEGDLFSSAHLESGEWNEIGFEFHEYRNGMMRFELTGLWALLGTHELIGHSGSNNSFAFYCPDEELYIVGTLNEVSDPSVQYGLMIRLVDSIVN